MATKRAPDAIVMLKEDHKKVSALLDRYEKARGSASKSKIAGQICDELTVHAKLEEEIFYPTARAEVREVDDLLDEAEVEHDSLKMLIAQIETSTPDDQLYDAKVKVLGEYVKHHVKEEEREMFPKIRKSGLDLRSLADQMRARKRELVRGSSAPARKRR